MLGIIKSKKILVAIITTIGAIFIAYLANTKETADTREVVQNKASNEINTGNISNSTVNFNQGNTYNENKK